jgi:hypothetical protein
VSGENDRDVGLSVAYAPFDLVTYPSDRGVCIPRHHGLRRRHPGTFTVIGDDPHRFDSDNDGIGCEA